MLPGHQLVRELCESITPALMVSNQGKLCIGPDKDSLCTFLTHQFKHAFWVLKRTVSLRGFFEYPQHIFWLVKLYFFALKWIVTSFIQKGFRRKSIDFCELYAWLKNKKNNFPVRTLI